MKRGIFRIIAGIIMISLQLLSMMALTSAGVDYASSDVLPDRAYDFVFANILHNVLASIMSDLKRIMKTGAKIVLSGILEGKESVVKEAIEINNMKIIEQMHQNEWIAFVVERED